MAFAWSLTFCPRRRHAAISAGVATVCTWGLGLMSALAVSGGSAAHAAEVSFSGFGTVGYAISDQPYRFQRFLDDRGTFMRDTVLGGQADLKLSSQWSATYQAMAQPSFGNDDDWSLRTTWAFVSWRPNNDWLLRAGKQRVPLFLNAENRDVGQTHDFARLPTEVYGLAPTTDLIGLYVSRSWFPAIGETTLDVFAGEAKMTARAHARDLGPIFMPVKTDVRGLALTLKQEKATWRAGFHHVATEMRGGLGFPSHYPLISSMPGATFYGVLTQMGAQYTRRILNDVISLGVDVELAPNWRVMAEGVRNVQMRTENGQNTTGGYIAVLHKMDRFTPYVSVSTLHSTNAALKTVRQLDEAQVPALMPESDQVSMVHRAAADVIQAFDQHSVALGASYAVTPYSKLKLEWMHTRIGERSAMVDSPQGGEPIRRQGIQVLSLNYSFAF